MALLVPANGGSFHHLLDSTDQEFGIIGPIPANRWIDLLYLSVWASDAVGADVAFTLGSSASAGREGFAAGIPIIQRSGITVEGVPGIRTGFLTAGQQRMTLGVGRRVATGPSFLHVGMNTVTRVIVYFTVSIRVLGLAVETRERLGLFEEVRLP